MDRLNPSRVLFLGEQDGPFERTLKSSLIANCLSFQPSVSAAYLTRVSYQETPGQNVALCLHGGEENATAIVDCLGAIFREHFQATEHLDILFLSVHQLEEAAKVAKPFYILPKP